MKQRKLPAEPIMVYPQSPEQRATIVAVGKQSGYRHTSRFVIAAIQEYIDRRKGGTPEQQIEQRLSAIEGNVQAILRHSNIGLTAQERLEKGRARIREFCRTLRENREN